MKVGMAEIQTLDESVPYKGFAFQMFPIQKGIPYFKPTHRSSISDARTVTTLVF